MCNEKARSKQQTLTSNKNILQCKQIKQDEAVASKHPHSVMINDANNGHYAAGGDVQTPAGTLYALLFA